MGKNLIMGPAKLMEVSLEGDFKDSITRKRWLGGRRWRKRRRTFALCSIVRRRRNRRVRRRRRRKRGRPLYLPQGVPSPPLPGGGGGVHTSAEDREVRPFSSSSCMAAAPEFPGDQVRRGGGGGHLQQVELEGRRNMTPASAFFGDRDGTFFTRKRSAAFFLFFLTFSELGLRFREKWGSKKGGGEGGVVAF